MALETKGSATCAVLGVEELCVGYNIYGLPIIQIALMLGLSPIFWVSDAPRVYGETALEGLTWFYGAP